MNEPVKPPIEDQFALLYERLQFFHSSGLDSVFKVAGFLLLVTGWVLTSDNVRELLSRDPLVRWAAVATLIFAAATFTGITLRAVRQSEKIFRQLKDLGYMPTEHFEDLEVRFSTVAPFLVLDFVLTFALCVFVLRL